MALRGYCSHIITELNIYEKSNFLGDLDLRTIKDCASIAV